MTTKDKKEDKVKYFSMFSGVGGFELGIGEAGECVGWSEIDKYAIQTYERHYGKNGDRVFGRNGQATQRNGKANPSKPSVETAEKNTRNGRNTPSSISTRTTREILHNGKPHKNYGDATTIDERKLPDFDLLVGGFPCQAFSIAGKRKGFDDTRGTLFFDIARILKHKRPQHLLLENVKGLLTHDSGKTFQTILGVLADLGYGVEWQVLNGKRWVPQNRERVIIIGHLGEKCRRTVLPFTAEKPMDSKKHKQTLGSDISWSLDANYFKGVSPKGYQGSKRQLVASGEGLPNRRNKSVNSDTEWGESYTVSSTQAHATVAKELSSALPEAMGKGGGHVPMAVLTPDRLKKRQNGRRMKEPNEPAFTLNTQDVHGVYNGLKIRRLTPKECERLMGWPDDWTAGVSDTQRYKQCGNGIIAPMVTEIIKQMKLCLTNL